MKKQVWIVLGVVILLLGMLFFATGFRKIPNVVLNDYGLSEDGTALTLRVGVAGSMGYVRDCGIKEIGGGRYLTFYATYGGLNSPLGARNEFTVRLDPDCRALYFNRGAWELDGYEEVLRKDESTGQWVRP